MYTFRHVSSQEYDDVRPILVVRRGLRRDPLLHGGPSIMRKRFLEYVPIMSDLYSPPKQLRPQEHHMIGVLFDKKWSPTFNTSLSNIILSFISDTCVIFDC